jgi:hypothetical protein
MNASAARAQERLLVPLSPAYQPTFTAMLLQLVEGNNKYSRVPLRDDFVQKGSSKNAARRKPKALPRAPRQNKKMSATPSAPGS